MTSKLDIIVVGATGYTGEITCKYLNSLKEAAGAWGIAGRDEAKLAALKKTLQRDTLPTFVTDFTKPETLDAVCAKTICVLDCAGPFTKVGMPVVEACVRNGTHYVDSTGEYNYVRLVAEKFHETAKNKKLAIVSCCGFDSVPSDLGNYVLHKSSQEPLAEVKGYFLLNTVGLSNGTVQSMASVADALQKADLSPASLVPADAVQPRATPRQRTAWYDREEGVWVAPFLMASINERVVRRSNALRGSSASYMEVMETSFGKAIGSTMRSYLTSAMLAVRPVRQYLVNRYFPAGVNHGPAEEARGDAFFRCKFVGKTVSGKKVTAIVAAKREMYEITGVFLGECALSAVALAKKQQIEGGVLTPSVAFGDELVRRCVANGLEVTPHTFDTSTSKKA